MKKLAPKLAVFLALAALVFSAKAQDHFKSFTVPTYLAAFRRQMNRLPGPKPVLTKGNPARACMTLVVCSGGLFPGGILRKHFL